MTTVKPSILNHYVQLYQKNPNSRLFAPLADLYRRAGNTDKALNICQKGIRLFPKWALGYVTLAMIWLDLNKQNLAQQTLETAIQLSPENLLAHKLLGQMWIQQKNSAKTLETYQTILCLDPEDKKARRIIQKLKEAHTVIQDETGFTFKNLHEVSQHLDPEKEHPPTPPPIHPLPKPNSQKEKQQFDHRLSFMKSLIHKKDFKKAKQGLTEMQNIYGNHQELKQQIQTVEDQLSLEQKRNIPAEKPPQPTQTNQPDIKKTNSNTDSFVRSSKNSSL